MAGKPVKGSRSGLIREFLRKHGPATVGEIVAGVGRYVPASACIRRYETNRKTDAKDHKNPGLHRSYAKRKLETGRRSLINVALSYMRKRGHIIRTAPATYDLAPHLR